MNNIFQKIIIIVGVALLIFMVSITCYSVKDKQIEQKTEPVESVTATVTPKNNIGTLTIYNENNELLYQYYGEIDVNNSGWNGDEVDVVINLSSTTDSCFDAEGNLLQ